MITLDILRSINEARNPKNEALNEHIIQTIYIHLNPNNGYGYRRQYENTLAKMANAAGFIFQRLSIYEGTSDNARYASFYIYFGYADNHRDKQSRLKVSLPAKYSILDLSMDNFLTYCDIEFNGRMVYIANKKRRRIYDTNQKQVATSTSPHSIDFAGLLFNDELADDTYFKEPARKFSDIEKFKQLSAEYNRINKDTSGETVENEEMLKSMTRDYISKLAGVFILGGRKFFVGTYKKLFVQSKEFRKSLDSASQIAQFIQREQLQFAEQSGIFNINEPYLAYSVLQAPRDGKYTSTVMDVFVDVTSRVGAPCFAGFRIAAETRNGEGSNYLTFNGKSIMLYLDDQYAYSVAEAAQMITRKLAKGEISQETHNKLASMIKEARDGYLKRIKNNQ